MPGEPQAPQPPPQPPPTPTAPAPPAPSRPLNVTENFHNQNFTYKKFIINGFNEVFLNYNQVWKVTTILPYGRGAHGEKV